jgi:hypothetical protein
MPRRNDGVNSESDDVRFSRRVQVLRHSQLIKLYVRLILAMLCVGIASICVLTETTVGQIRKPYGPDDRQLYFIRVVIRSLIDWLVANGISKTEIRVIVSGIAIVCFGTCWIAFRYARRDRSSRSDHHRKPN